VLEDDSENNDGSCGEEGPYEQCDLADTRRQGRGAGLAVQSGILFLGGAIGLLRVSPRGAGQKRRSFGVLFRLL